MQIALIVLSALCGVLSLAFGLPIAAAELERWPKLAWVERNRLPMAAAAILLTILTGALATWDRAREELKMTSGPGGEIAPSASHDALEKEFDDAARQSKAEASEAFRNGEKMMEAQKFASAADAFELSAARVPTKSALTNLALAKRFAGDLPGSEKAARAAIALPGDEDSVIHATTLLQLGITLSDSGKRPEAQALLQSAHKRFEKNGNATGLAATEYSLGVYEHRGGNTTAASNWFTSANDRFKQGSDRVGQATVMNVLGVIKLERGATNEGIETLNEAATLYTQLNNKVGAAGALLNIGSAYQDKCQLDAALTAYAGAAEAAKEVRNRLIETLGTVNAANALLERGDVAAASKKADEALVLCRDISAPEVEGWAHLTLAGAHREQGRIDDAKAEAALAGAKFANVSAVGVLITSIEEAKVAILMKRYDDAGVLLDKAQTTAATSQYDLYRPAILEASAELFEAKGDRANARKTLIAAHAMNQQLAIGNCVARRIENRLKTLAN